MAGQVGPHPLLPTSPTQLWNLLLCGLAYGLCVGGVGKVSVGKAG